MEIAPGVEAGKWQALRLDDPAGPDGPEAIRILEARIHERFIDPVDHLITAEEARPVMERRFGFAVLAVDCLLIETLGAFLKGLPDTVGKSEATFCEFLTTRPLFKDEFTPERAKRFYKEFRCGILHQAEIGGDSRVWSVGPMLQDDGRRIIVNRNKFHESLKNEFQTYLVERGSVPTRTRGLSAAAASSRSSLFGDYAVVSHRARRSRGPTRVLQRQAPTLG
jgi:hypothetical protein